jgi:hypothetical protein
LVIVNGVLAGIQTRYFATGSVTAALISGTAAVLATVLGLALSR